MFIATFSLCFRLSGLGLLTFVMVTVDSSCFGRFFAVVASFSYLSVSGFSCGCFVNVAFEYCW